MAKRTKKNDVTEQTTTTPVEAPVVEATEAPTPEATVAEVVKGLSKRFTVEVPEDAAPEAIAELLSGLFPGVVVKAVVAKGTATHAPTPCLCGCGGEARGKKAVFAPGHDMTLKSRIVANTKADKPWSEGLTDEQIDYADDNWTLYISQAVDRATAKRLAKQAKAQPTPATPPEATAN